MPPTPGTRAHAPTRTRGRHRQPGSGAPPVAYDVLYRRGDEEQARLLARVLKQQRPRVAPINPTTVRAIGSATPRLAVVIP
jgi:hypothetical protein